MATKKVKETDYLTDEALQAKDLYTRYSNLYDNYTREENKYKDQTESLGQQLINYKPFTYDINSDVMYRQYKDQYQKLGQQAMADTMGQAAALTGGYGNSYAATVGNQAYQSYLQQLYDRIPELYNMALNNYNTNRSNLESALATASQLYNMEENRIDNDYQLLADKYNAYMSRYDTLSNRDYTAYSDALALAEQQRQFNAQMAEDRRQFNANLAYQREADNYAAIINGLKDQVSAYENSQFDYTKAKQAYEDGLGKNNDIDNGEAALYAYLDSTNLDDTSKNEIFDMITVANIQYTIPNPNGLVYVPGFSRWYEKVKK